MKTHILSIISLIVLLAIPANSSICSDSGQLNQITTGVINLITADLISVGLSTTYTFSIDSANFDGSQLGYALGNGCDYVGLAGFQATASQNYYSLIVSQVQFKNTNTLMSIQYRFTHPSMSVGTTSWLRIKMTYLIISSTFDGGYSNIWASTAQLNPSITQIVNLPIDPIGNQFSVNGGSPKDCDVYINPLMQIDLSNCEEMAAQNQYKGGRSIIHAYIMGFSFNGSDPNVNVSVSKGSSNSDRFSDSDGWSIYYSSVTPNGPEVSIPYQQNKLTWIQISFVFVRMDYFAVNYPLNSQLQYSSSHIFTSVNTFNTPIPFSRGATNQYNQNYFLLPDNKYSIYGLTSFSLNNYTAATTFSLFVSVDRSSATVNTVGNSVSNVIISGDIFIKNVEKLCNSKQNQKYIGPSSNIVVKITPDNKANSVTDVTGTISTSTLTSNSNAVVYKFSSQPRPKNSQNTYAVTFKYSQIITGAIAKIQLRYFQIFGINSLIAGSTYSLIAVANGITVYRNTFKYQADVKALVSPVILKGIQVDSNQLIIQLVVSFASDSQSVQDFYVVLAVYQYTQIYDPELDCCANQCSAEAGIDASILPLVCIKCDSSAGLTYSAEQGKCICKSTYYLSPTNGQCYPCANTLCNQCNPLNSIECYLCLPSAKLFNGTCICQNNQYQTATGCANCPSSCKTCTGPSGLCLTCNNNSLMLGNTCQCASGYFDQGKGDCSSCDPKCSTCDANGLCLTCRQSDNRILSNNSCACKSKYYQSYSAICQLCSDICLTCSSTSTNCTSCDSSLNRMLLNNNCVCPNGYTPLGLQCVQNNCNLDPFCTQCVNTSSTQQTCIQCNSQLKRVLDLNSHLCVCKSGYYDNKNGNCLPCGNGCLLCTTLANCTACATLAQANGDGTCKCPASTFLAISSDQIRYCRNCANLCQSCSDQFTCQVCQSNAALINGVCQCNTAMYFNASTQSCQNCQSGCADCYNCTVCNTCQSPLLFYAGNCIANCSVGFSQTGNTCVPCTSNCLICENTQICNTCTNNYSLFNGQCFSVCPSGTIGVVLADSSTCNQCISPCKTCLNSPSFCTSCINQNLYLYLSTNSSQTCIQNCPLGTVLIGQSCKLCDSSCLACAGTSTNCIQCNSTLILYNGACVSTCPGIISSNSLGQICLDACPDGFYKVSQSVCAPCSSQCRTCDGTAINCTDCANGILADYGVCVSQCKDNQYISGGACLNCSSECAKCFKSQTNCIKCKPGLVKSGGRCIKACLKTQYYNASVGLCLTCKRSCGSCLNDTFCLTCKNRDTAPVKGECPFCSYPCSTCGQDSRCLSCQTGFNLFNGACLSKCPNSTIPINGKCACPMGVLSQDKCVSVCPPGSYSLNGQCFLCDSNCLQCTGTPTTCSKCYFGSHLNNGSCQPDNNCHYGQKLINSTCQRICPQSSFFLQFICTYGGCDNGYTSNQFGGCERMNRYQCDRNQYYLDGVCLLSCPLGYFSSLRNNKCFTCERNCDQCLNGRQCFKCSENYTNIGGNCYLNNCPAGQYSLDSQCVNICPIGTKQKQGICVPQCNPSRFLYNSLCYSTCPTTHNNGYACIETSTTFQDNGVNY